MANAFTIDRDDLGRFLSAKVESCVSQEGVNAVLGLASAWKEEAYRTDQLLKELTEFFEALGQDDNARYMFEQREELQKRYFELLEQEEELYQLELDSLYKDNDRGPMFLESAELDIADVTGLDAKEARALALRLSKWNPSAAKVYLYRQGKRYLTPAVVRMDLNDPVVKSMPFYDDVLDIVRERRLEIDYEDYRV